MKPVCCRCQRFYRPKRTGYYFIEGMPKFNEALPGTQAPEQWTPYKLWSGDLYECEGCGSEIISGVGWEPLAEHYQADFDSQVKRFDATLQVNDC